MDSLRVVIDESPKLRLEALLEAARAVNQIAHALNQPIRPTVHVHGNVEVHSGVGIRVDGCGKVSVDGTISSCSGTTIRPAEDDADADEEDSA